MEKSKNNKIGRNDPCYCGSGMKYKRCHGLSPGLISREEINSQFLQLQAKQKQREKQQGLGRPIISAIFKGHRFVAVGSGLYFSDKWKTFHDFLMHYIKDAIGSEWGNIELKKPFEERHPILQWYDQVCKHQQKHIKIDEEIYTAPMIGAVSAYLGLSYNLYLLAHNAKIQSRLISRLKDKKQFQSAYYETYVAAAFIKAGFELEFENEEDSTTSHCEFIATCRKTGNQYSVEAKSRVPGKPHVHISNQLHEALKKKAKYKRVVFIDVNVPDDANDVQNVGWLDDALNSIRGKETTMTVDGAPAPAAYLFVTNHTYQFKLETSDFRSSVIAEGFKIPEFKGGANFANIRDALRAREKHADMFQLISSLRDHYEIPSTFDGEIPEFAFEERVPIFRIGYKYVIPDPDGNEVIGVLTAATVSEKDKTIIGGYRLENGKSIIATCPATEDELAAYKRHSDTFFGIYQPQGKRLEVGDLLGLYDFFFESYKHTPREKLLEFLKQHPDYERLINEPQDELAKTYCEGLVYTVASSKNK